MAEARNKKLIALATGPFCEAVKRIFFQLSDSDIPRNRKRERSRYRAPSRRSGGPRACAGEAFFARERCQRRREPMINAARSLFVLQAESLNF